LKDESAREARLFCHEHKSVETKVDAQ